MGKVLRGLLVLTISIAAAAAHGDDHAEFAFIVNSLRNLRPNNVRARRQQRGWRLQEYQRLGRNVMPQLGGMLAIVAAHAHDLRGADRSEQHRFLERKLVGPLARQVVHVARGSFRRGEQAGDHIPAGDSFDQAVLFETLQLKAAIFHIDLYKHKARK